MHHRLRFIVACLALLMTLVALQRGALAQGVTGSALTGTVTAEGGGPIDGAALTLRNQSNGLTFTAVSDASGQYFFDNVPPGGPYTLAAKAPGYLSTTETDINLTLGQRFNVDLEMRGIGEEVVVVGRARTVLNDRGRTGESTTLRDTTITELPLQGRNFTDLIATAPGTTREAGGNSFAGQNNRYNNIQIDGGANNDLFGLAGSGTPGGQANAKPLSIEAIKEFVVQVAPFDVRQGNFAGGLVNAITKSGTNEYHGSVFNYYQNKTLSNTKYYNANGSYVEDPNYTGYYTWQFGAAVGGPIVKDKLHFFVSADIQQAKRSFGSTFNISGDDSSADIARAGFDAATAQRFIDILRGYGIGNVGDASSPQLANPDRNVFVKLTTSLVENTDIELSYNFVNASQDVFIRAPTSPTIPGRLRDGYELSNSGYNFTNTTNTGRLKVTSNWAEGKLSNEFLAGFSIIRDSRSTPTNWPLILVKSPFRLGNSDSWLAAGGERFSQANSLDQDVWQVQDNVTYAIEKHRITLGTSNEFFKFRNVFLQAATGVWAFNSLDDFQNGNAAAFQRRFGVSPIQEPGTAAFSVAQLGFYLQDEWTLLKNLRVTPGLRIDVPFLSKANRNDALVENPNFPIDTSKVPSGNILWSPRLGLNWDVQGDSTTVVRGGTGIFSGRPPYVWVSNAYTINGLGQVELTCTPPPGGSGVPPFTPDPKSQPTTCVGGTAPVAPTNFGEIDYFDPNTKYPQNWRVALGADHRLPWGIIGSLDFLYTQDVNGWYTTDENLTYLANDGDGRAIYGTFPNNVFTGSPTVLPVPTRIDSGPNARVTQAVKVFNKNGGKVYSATVQLTKQFLRRLDVSVAYTYSKSEDRISLTSSQALSNFQFEPIDGTIQDRNVRPSAFDRPHKVTISGYARLPYGFGAGLTYVGQSGTPYTWVVNGDVNGDGINGNDLVFVPADPSQISLSGTPQQQSDQWDALNRFIQSQDCLRDARGHFVQRGACRNPWQSFVDLRLSWISPDIIKGQHFEVQFDIFNLMNLLNSKWGHFDTATQFETHGQTFLRAVGYDRVNNRPIYSYSDPTFVTQTLYSPTQSRWRMQLGARYIF